MVEREPADAGLAAGTALEDRPRSAYRALEARTTWLTTGLLVGLGALAWAWTIDSSEGMADMATGLAPDAMAMMRFDMGVVLFLGMWLAMMVAMMFPTVAPIVLLHRLVARRRGEGVLSSVAFVGGYLAVWTAVGLVPWVLLTAVRDVPRDNGWLVPFGGAVLVLAGAYQFTSWKETCQRACQSPLSFVMTHDFGRGAPGAARVGASHGLYCVGCCWGLMAVLVVVGLTNLVWMAAIALLFLAEKHWRHALALSRVVGTGLVALGVVVLLSPGTLQTVTG